MGKIRVMGISVLAVVLAACGSSGSSSAHSDNGVAYSAQSVADFAVTVATPGVVVLDVRTPAEFEASHIAGAVNVDVQSADFESRIDALDKSGTYAVYCHSGRRSAIAVEQMAAAGFAHLSELDGGIQAWMAAGQKVVTS